MLSQGELGPECFGLEQTLHIMLSQREAEMRSETYQPDNKRPDEEQKKKAASHRRDMLPPGN